MDEIYRQFGQRVRQHRKIKKLSQEELGELTQLGRATIAAIEGGRQTVALHQLILLSKKLDVGVNNLVFDDQTAVLDKHKGNLGEHDLRIVQQLMAN
jgi:transcriptional regulator with XRE-family HTH domain